MVTQLDWPVLLRLTHINANYLTMPLFFFSAELKAIDLALDHNEQTRNTDFIIFLIPSLFFNLCIIAEIMHL